MFASKDIFQTASTGGYKISRSVRLRSSASAYFNRTLTTPTSSQKFTWSGWTKRGKLDSSGLQGIFCPYSSGTVYGYLAWYQDGIRIFDRLSGGTNYLLQTTAVYRDPSAWYHIVYAVDTTQATAANRVRLYVNGVEVTSFSTSTYPTQNNSTTTNSAIAHNIGYDPSNVGYFDGYLTETNFIDGQALTPSFFGETNSITGVWQPKKYGGTYGTNGFYLNFSDNSNNTATTIGKDYSGNGNNWTPNNISVTAGVTYDSMVDSPTVGATSSNYAVLNPLSNGYGTAATISITDGNLNFSDATSTTKTCISSMTASSGKWYVEMTCSSSSGTYSIGLLDKTTNNESWYRNSGAYSSSFGGSGTTGYSSWTTGDVIGIAWDADAGKIWFSKNNTWQSGSPSAGTSPTNTFTAGLSLFPDVYTDNSAGTKSGSFNFGQRPFSYTPPTGFVALNTQNLPTPTISNGASYMAATTYTGTGSALTIANTVGSTSFQPDFVWVKGRSGATDHALYDSVRGTTKDLVSNSTAAETTQATGLTAFGSTGFTIGALAKMNTNTATYVGWQWKETPSAGFDIVACATNGSGIITATSHNLGVVPSMIILKALTGTDSWYVYHKNSTATPTQGTLQLNATGAVNTTNGSSGGVDKWTVSSSTFAAGNAAWTYQASTNNIAYLFAPVAGYSAFGSYTGNGSADGPFVFLGFRPRFIMFKCSTSAGTPWVIVDTSRNPSNAASLKLAANNAEVENGSAVGNTTENLPDINSNGFKMRSVNTSTNGSGETIIYMAFAENPFKYSLAR